MREHDRQCRREHHQREEADEESAVDGERGARAVAPVREHREQRRQQRVDRDDAAEAGAEHGGEGGDQQQQRRREHDADEQVVARPRRRERNGIGRQQEQAGSEHRERAGGDEAEPQVRHDECEARGCEGRRAREEAQAPTGTAAARRRVPEHERRLRRDAGHEADRDVLGEARAVREREKEEHRARRHGQPDQPAADGRPEPARRERRARDHARRERELEGEEPHARTLAASDGYAAARSERLARCRSVSTADCVRPSSKAISE